MFWYNQNPWLPAREAFFSCWRIQKSEERKEEEEMENDKIPISSKGGRPKKAIRKDRMLTLKCSLTEKFIIEAKAKKSGLTVSEYLRAAAINGKIDMPKKTLPPEVLQLSATLNHLAANLNQIAKKRNSFEQLDAIERAGLELQSKELKIIAATIKHYLR